MQKGHNYNVRLIYITFFIDLLIPDLQLNAHRKIHGSKTLLIWSSLIRRPVHCSTMPFITVATHSRPSQKRARFCWAATQNEKSWARHQCSTDFVSSGESREYITTCAFLSIQFDPQKFNFAQITSPTQLTVPVANSSNHFRTIARIEHIRPHSAIRSNANR